MPEYNYMTDFQSKTSLKEYGSNAHLLYVLQLHQDIDDIATTASEALTDGYDDKKCDLIYIDINSGITIIAQAYYTEKTKSTAPVNKASDLNTAAAWLFSSDLDSISGRINSQVAAFQEAIKDNNITTIYFWFVHNCNETSNVKTELRTVQSSVQKLADEFSDNSVSVLAQEIGNETIEKMYQNMSDKIWIPDTIEVNNEDSGFLISSESKWTAYVTAVKGSWLKNLKEKYGNDLFSRNPRNYLGVSKNTINTGIQATLNDEPQNFWTYNNGVTALVLDFKLNDKGLENITGIAIINGAQTTGAISSNPLDKGDPKVLIRFIRCEDNKIVDSIIRNNNKQNEILPSDLRSNDKFQNKLRENFKSFPRYYYNGGKRSENKISQDCTEFAPHYVAQFLKAFHGDPVSAYNKSKQLWLDDNLYISIFSKEISAEHIIFVYSLARAIDNYKNSLYKKENDRTTSEDEQYSFLKKRGAKMLLISIIKDFIETLWDKKISNFYGLKFKNSQESFEDLAKLWTGVVKTVMGYQDVLSKGLSLDEVGEGLKSNESYTKCKKNMSAIFNSLIDTYRAAQKDFIEKITT